MADTTTIPPIDNAAIRAVFEAWPPGLRSRLLHLRRLVFETAAATEGVGELDETLKWGQPAYLTTRSGSGSTIRLGALRGQEGYALYFICHTGLVERFSELYPSTLHCVDNRALHFGMDDALPEAELRHCVQLALTYHVRKRGAGSGRRAPSAD
ncbi:DUF1801 domain-containing protein [Nitratireductor sp. CAU 1489]|uniref:DUF1801 domain-containing protein n=1 Tax=Nitratireductor arenosus TaxID=2682096 RepID=A0A844QQA7_9HYPH|nr:DUF1801 domain-containing protein [Nitratireductor arenosus]MVB00151.1 DUF1801 domain-containing protein [Nitratireductor arenosus]